MARTADANTRGDLDIAIAIGQIGHFLDLLSSALAFNDSENYVAIARRHADLISETLDEALTKLKDKSDG